MVKLVALIVEVEAERALHRQNRGPTSSSRVLGLVYYTSNKGPNTEARASPKPNTLIDPLEEPCMEPFVLMF